MVYFMENPHLEMDDLGVIIPISGNPPNQIFIEFSDLTGISWDFDGILPESCWEKIVGHLANPVMMTKDDWWFYGVAMESMRI